MCKCASLVKTINRVINGEIEKLQLIMKSFEEKKYEKNPFKYIVMSYPL